MADLILGAGDKEQVSRAGYDGKGVFYAFAAGNGHEMGDDANLDELANYYGVTAVCAVNDHDTRSGFSEMGANLWVCASSNDLTDPPRGHPHHRKLRPLL